jgi:hypothetical protein
VSASATVPRGTNARQLAVDIFLAARRLGPTQAFEHIEDATAFAVTQSIRSCGVFGDRLANDMALRLAQSPLP